MSAHTHTEPARPCRFMVEGDKNPPILSHHSCEHVTVRITRPWNNSPHITDDNTHHLHIKEIELYDEFG
jgi:hypothetical protein